MFKDITLSRDLVAGFREYKTKGKRKGSPSMQVDKPEDREPKLSVMILQQSVWPFTPRKQDVDLPSHVRMSFRLVSVYSRG